MLTRAVVLARGNVLTPDLLGLSLPQGQPNSPATSAADGELELITLDELEARHVQKILHHTRWHKGHACEILGISRPALERKINKYSIR